jgi:molecular chaperone GrpE
LNDQTEEVLEDVPSTSADPDSPEAALLDKLAADLEEHKNLYLRTLADFQNFKRRSVQEKQEFQKFATQELARDLLPVLDNLERTLSAAETGATLESLTEGVKAMERQLRAVLDQRHIKRIESIGKPFDPDLHEALGQDISPNVEPGTITFEIEAGYRMGDKVLRPARVRVAGQP